jgi:hypothetical protein
MNPDDATRPKTSASNGTDKVMVILTEIEEQGRQTLELLRRMLALLLPQEGGREGPSLEQLLAQLIAQQRETISIARATQADLNRMQETLPGAVASAVEEERHFVRRPN